MPLNKETKPELPILWSLLSWTPDSAIYMLSYFPLDISYVVLSYFGMVPVLQKRDQRSWTESWTLKSNFLINRKPETEGIC